MVIGQVKWIVIFEQNWSWISSISYEIFCPSYYNNISSATSSLTDPQALTDCTVAFLIFDLIKSTFTLFRYQIFVNFTEC